MPRAPLYWASSFPFFEFTNLQRSQALEHAPAGGPYVHGLGAPYPADVFDLPQTAQTDREGALWRRPHGWAASQALNVLTPRGFSAIGHLQPDNLILLFT